MIPFLSTVTTFLWILLLYIFIHIGSEHIGFLKNLNLNSIVIAYPIAGNREFLLRTKELFLILGSIALFVEITKASHASKFGAIETLTSYVVSIVFIVMFFSVTWAQNATFLILAIMSLIDATGGFMIELNAARKDINVN